VVQGEERAALNMGIGWRGLNRMMERFKDNMEFTKLKPKMAGIDPDDVYSEVPYEKGFQFLWRIERQVGTTRYLVCSFYFAPFFDEWGLIVNVYCAMLVDCDRLADLHLMNS
jgi:hypothetical protein